MAACFLPYYWFLVVLFSHGIIPVSTPNLRHKVGEVLLLKKKIISIKQHVFLFYFNIQNNFFIFRKMTSHSIIRHYVAVNKNLLVDSSLRMIYVSLCGIASTRLSLSKYHPYLFIFLCNFL